MKLNFSWSSLVPTLCLSILYTPIQKINDIYCYDPMFHIQNNNLVIIIMHIDIIIIRVLFLLFLIV